MTGKVKKTRARGGASKSGAAKSGAPAEKVTASGHHESNVADDIRAAAMERPPHLLKTLDPQVREEVLSQCAIRRHAEGERIIREGEQADNMYFIARGRARVASSLRNGREAAFIRLEQGEHFGALSLLDGHSPALTITALTDACVIVMPAPVFRRMLDQHPAMLVALLKQSVAMVRGSLKRILKSSGRKRDRRIRTELLRLTRKASQTGDKRTRIKRAPPGGEHGASGEGGALA